MIKGIHMAKKKATLRRKHCSTDVISAPLAESLRQSSPTKQKLEALRIQVEESKKRDWLVGEPT